MSQNVKTDMALTARPKKPSHYKKRQAQHHRHSKRYVKAYWPYLPMLLIVGLGMFINSAWSQPHVLGSASDFSADLLLMQTNNERSRNKESGLYLDPQLTDAAQAKANDLVAKNYWAHTSPSGDTPWTFITQSGYQYQLAGENLAYGFTDAKQVIAGWMNSQEHRDNILNQSYQDVGFGVASAPNYLGKGPQTIVVAEYGEPAPAAANIHFTVNNPNSQVKGEQTELASKRVARIQVLTQGNATWSLLALSALTGAAVTIFLLRHSYRIHRTLTRGEMFIAHHPWFDIGVVFVATAGLLLTHTSGLIR